MAAVCKLTDTTQNFSQTDVTNGSCTDLVIEGTSTITLTSAIEISGTLTVTDTAVVQHGNESLVGVNVIAANIDIQNGSKIDVTGKGYAGGIGATDAGPAADGNGPGGGRGGGNGGSQAGEGGSHGGLGGTNDSTGDQNGTYGNPGNPTTLGSGGGGSIYSTGGDGGNGGGLIRLIATNTITIDGSLLANGNVGATASRGAGGGAGGAIYVKAPTVTCTDGNTDSTCDYSRVIEAKGGNGGGAGAYNKTKGAAGGGGIITVLSDNVTNGVFTGISAANNTTGGVISGSGNPPSGTPNGANGRLFSGSHLTCYLGANTVINQSFVNDNSCGKIQTINDALTITLSGTINLVGNGQFIIGDGSSSITTTFSGTMTLDNSDYLVIKDNAALTHAQGSSAGLEIVADKIQIDSTGSIDVIGKGSSGGAATVAGEGTGGGNAPSGVSGGSGGGHGGKGGNGNLAVGGSTHGSQDSPITLGSGGSGGNGCTAAPGGAGGGRVRLNIGSELIVTGHIYANGAAGGNGTSCGRAGGAGSGGSIWITAGSISGSGNIHAKGGIGGDASSSYQDGAGGGGGRISITANMAWDSSDISSSRFSVDGGLKGGVNGPPQDGTEGTILVIDSDSSSTYYKQGYNFDSNLSGVFYILPGNNYSLGASPLSMTKTGTLDLASIIISDTSKNLIFNVDTLNLTGSSMKLKKINLNGTTVTVDGTSTLEADEIVADLTTFNINNGGNVTTSGHGGAGGAPGNPAAAGTGDGGGSGGQCNGSGGGGGGGGYGAAGGKGGGNDGGAGGSTYGSSTNPTDPGSGGGGACGCTSASGGSGGGVISVNSTSLVVDGTLQASGNPGGNATGCGRGGGGGSGGSINILTKNISGTGNIYAKGGKGGNGAGTYNDGGGGGGGRFVLNYQNDLNNFLDTLTNAASGGATGDGANGSPVAGSNFQVTPQQLPTANFSTASQNVTETVGTVTITVNLSTSFGSTVTVSYTVTGSADKDGGNADHNLANGNITVTSGQTQGTKTFTVANDPIDEDGEAVIVTMGSPTNAFQGATKIQTITIADDDMAGIIKLESGGSTNVTEGNVANDTYTLRLATKSLADVTVTVDPGDDVTVDKPSLTFTTLNWNQPQTITVSSVNDNLYEGNHVQSISHASTSSDAKYNIPNAPPVNVNVTDNDTAAVVIVETAGATNTTEGGATDNYKIVLTSKPLADVKVRLIANTEVTLSKTQFKFTSENWDQPKTILVTAVDDTKAEGTHDSTITHVSLSTDDDYDSLTIPSVTAWITDNDTAGVTITKSSPTLTVAEGGDPVTYTVALTSQPLSGVKIVMTADEQVSLSPSSLIFTAGNWSTAQTVTVTAVDDTAAEEALSATINHKAESADLIYAALSIEAVVVAITDNDTGTEEAMTATARAAKSIREQRTGGLIGSSNVDDVTCLWTQVGDSSATIEDASSCITTFTAPDVSAGTTITFELTVSDGENTATATVNIRVLPEVVTEDDVQKVGVTGAVKGTTSSGGIIKKETIIYDGEHRDRLGLPNNNWVYFERGAEIKVLSIGGRTIIGYKSYNNHFGVLLSVGPDEKNRKIDLDNDDLSKYQYTSVYYGSQAYGYFASYLVALDINGDGIEDVAASSQANNGTITVHDAEDLSLYNVFLGTDEYQASSNFIGSRFLGGDADEIIIGVLSESINLDVIPFVDLSYLETAESSNYNVLSWEDEDTLNIQSDAQVYLSEVVSTNLMATGDLWENDGNEDLVVASTSGSTVYLYAGVSEYDLKEVMEVTTSMSFEDCRIGALAVGDVNGDDIADLVVGCPNSAGGKGSIYVIFGMDETNMVQIVGEDNGAIGGFIIVSTDSDGEIVIYTNNGEDDTSAYYINQEVESETSVYGQMGPGGMSCSLQKTKINHKSFNLFFNLMFGLMSVLAMVAMLRRLNIKK